MQDSIRSSGSSAADRDPKEFDEITGTLGEVLSEAWQRMLQ